MAFLSVAQAPSNRRSDQREHDAKRYAHKPWRAWYSLKAWQTRRAHQLAKQPLCERHLAQGMVVAATVANHKTPHRGDWNLFITGELESVCKPCHDGPVQSEERGTPRQATGLDGWPITSTHARSA